MELYDINDKKIELHNIVFASTSLEIAFEEERYILLEKLDDLGMYEYVVACGFHCSCYDFDDVYFDAIKYSYDELKKLAEKHISDVDSDSEAERALYEFILEYL